MLIGPPFMTISNDSLNLLEVGRTNDSHSIEEERLIRQCLIAAEERIQQLTPELASLTSQVSRYRIAVAPYKKLPEDVLRYIFTLCCDKPLRPGKHNTAVILSQVSSSWRHLVFHMLHIWASVDLKIPYGPYIDDRKVSLARQWLSRAGSLPRTLYVQDNSTNYRSANDSVQRLIAAYSYQRLDLDLHWDRLTSLRNVPAKRFTLLEYLRLQCPDRYMHGSVPLPPLVKLPSLIHLDLELYQLSWDIEDLTFAVPWHRMECLDLQIPIPAMVCFNTILRQGTQLTHCFLSPAQDPTFTPMSTAFIDPVVLSKLEYLELDCGCPDNAAAFERLLVTPNVPHYDHHICVNLKDSGS